jgi:hypothetical protein
MEEMSGMDSFTLKGGIESRKVGTFHVRFEAFTAMKIQVNMKTLLICPVFINGNSMVLHACVYKPVCYISHEKF